MHMPFSGRTGIFATFALLIASAAGEVFAQGGAAKTPALVSANYRPVPDSIGNQWNVRPDGTIETNNGLSGAGRLMVFGNSFSPQQNQMTPDGREYVHTGSVNGLEVVRRVKIDAGLNAARFVDIFTNRQPTDVNNAEVSIYMGARSSTFSPFFCDGGDAGGAFNDKTTGCVSLPQTSGPSTYTAIGVYLASPGSKGRPTKFTTQSRSMQVTYSLTIPRGGSVALLYGVRQFKPTGGTTSPRYAAPPATVNPTGVRTVYVQAGLDPKSVAEALEPFRTKEFAQDLDPAIRKQLVNYSLQRFDSEVHGAPRQALDELLETLALERGEVDLLVADDETTLEGDLVYGRLTIETAFGKAEVPLVDLAAIVGGAGSGRPMRALLRNGEVLVGPITTEHCVLSTDGGLRVELDPQILNVAVMRKLKTDDMRPPVVQGYLTTSSGDRLAIALQSDDVVHAATPWGRITTPLAEVEGLGAAESSPIGVILRLRDQTRVPVIVTGAPWELQSTRWGLVTVAPATIRRWDRIVPVRKTDDGEMIEEPTFDPDSFAEPHVRLVDDSIIVGEVVEAELHVAAPDRLRTIEPRFVGNLRRNDDGGFDCRLNDGQEFSGPLNESLLTIRSGERSLRVPVHQIAYWLNHAAPQQPPLLR